MFFLSYITRLLPQRINRLVLPMFLAFSTWTVMAAPSYEVTDSKGVAKIQRAQKRANETITIKSKILDNDIVETYFQASMVALFGKGNIVILGPNSKALFTITERSGPSGPVIDASITLFNGGICIKVFSSARVSIFTPNAVCETDSGSISAIVETKTNETGFQVLGGRGNVRNIAQQSGRDLSAGQTSMVLPGREPTAPLFLTTRHVSVLRIFFGDDYINTELQTNSIIPTEDLIGESRIRLSDNLASRQGENRPVVRMSYERPFRQSVIWGRILDDRTANPTLYQPVTHEGPLFKNAGSLSARFDIASAAGTAWPALTVTPSYRIGVLDAGLRLSFARTVKSRFVPVSFNEEMPGVFDLIDHITVGWPQDSLHLTLGPIDNYTLGRGLVVNRFSNRDQRSLLHPLGLYGRADLFHIVTFDGFIANLADPSIAGGYLSFRPSLYYVGVGYFTDLNQFSQAKNNNAWRFQKPPGIASGSTAPKLNIIQADLGADLIAQRDVIFNITAQYAAPLYGRGGLNALLRLPYLSLNWNHLYVEAALDIEWGSMSRGLFGPAYAGNRYNPTLDSSGVVIGASTPHDTLPHNRMAKSIEAAFAINPAKGFSLELGATHDITSTNQTSHDSIFIVSIKPDTVWLDSILHTVDTVLPDTARDTTIAYDTTWLPPTFDFFISINFNDSLIKFLKYGSIFFHQSRGGMVPYGSTYFQSYGVAAGVHLYTKPLFMNVAAELLFDYFITELSPVPDRHADPGDRILQASFALHWGFM